MPAIFGFSPGSLRHYITVRHLPIYLIGLALSGLCAEPIAAASTSTQLQVSSTSVRVETPVTLTATVTANGSPVTPGQVLFCNASAPRCTDLAVLGTAQLTSNGTASIKLRLDPGSHSIYAKFIGTMTYPGSTSLPAVETVEVTGSLHSTANVSKYGNAGDYTLASSVAAFGTTPPTGTVSFLDAMTNQAIASASLDTFTLISGFTQATVYPTESTCSISVAVADVNDDGVPDLVATTCNNTVEVLLGNPVHSGQFLTPRSYATGVYPDAVAVADFNGDGVPDLVVANGSGTYGAHATVSVLLGDAQHPGQFLSQQTYLVGSGPTFVAVGDFNRDGLPDIAVANSNGQADISVLLNNPASPGQFLPQVTYLEQGAVNNSNGAKSVAVGDFNGDGVLDLAVMDGGTLSASVVDVLMGDPAHPGQFLPPVVFPVSSSTSDGWAIASGDFNADGIPDLAVTNYEYPSGASIVVLLGDPVHPGQFFQPVSYPISGFSAPYSLAIGDFNGDGVLDLAVPYDEGPSAGVLLGDPAHPGQFLPKVNYYSAGPGVTYAERLSTGDVNGDGVSDIVTVNRGYNVPAGDGTVSVLLGTLTETATAQHVNPGNTSYVYASYSGDSNYYSFQSCEISLTAGYWPVQPTISRVTVSNITQNSATISWTSDVATYGGINYGTTTALGSKTSWVDPVSVTHSFVLSNLKPGTTYDYQAWSVAYFSGCKHWTAFSPTATFTTAAQ
ncbi:MAG TPA: FG-GAP-like repeat-containing protein [Pseudacidobacterium sp.]|jgi:hypothetical protein|nr:FG-GAP-like repeat-containing protein [Pseudacidobacterium sp.]